MTKAERFWLFEQSKEEFVRFVFQRLYRSQPDETQLSFFRTEADDRLLNWCRQSGKTTCASTDEAYGAIFHPKTLGLVISATQRQAAILQKRALAVIRAVSGEDRHWRKVRDVVLPEDPFDENSRLVRCSVLSLEISNGSEVVSLPPHPDTIRGYSPDRLTLDEAARIPNAAYDAIRPMRAAHRCTLTVLSTPKSTFGFFYEEVYGKGKDDPVWWRSRMTADQCPRITPEFLAREKTKMSNLAAFMCEYYLVPMPKEGALFTPEQIQTMFVPAEKAPVKVIKPPLLVPGRAYERKETGMQRPQRFVPRVGYG